MNCFDRHRSRIVDDVAAPDVPLGWWEYYTVTDDRPDDTVDRPASQCCAAPATAGSASCC